MKTAWIFVFVGILAAFPSASTANSLTPAKTFRLLAIDNRARVLELTGREVMTARLWAPSNVHAVNLLEKVRANDRFSRAIIDQGEKAEGGFLFSMTVNVAQKKDRSDEAYLAAVEMIRQSLNDPYSAKFPASRKAKILPMRNDKYRVAGNFRAKNKFGAYVFKRYVAVVRYESGEWAMLEFEFQD